jgi:APA family basic amino acid/polyamine antiporter
VSLPGKKLSLLDATLLVSGSMIGSGIFIVTADMSRILGSAGWVLAAWMLTGILTLFAALSYGELAGMMPKVGGQYVYIQRAFGRLSAFVYGWSVFAVIQTGVIAAVAMAFAKYLGVFVPELGDGEKGALFNLGTYTFTSGKIVAVLLVLFLTWLNSLGVQEGKWVQRIFTFTKLFALFGLIVTGLYFANKYDFFSNNMANAWDAARYNDGKTGNVMAVGWESITGWAVITGLGIAMVGSIFSSDAWNNVTYIASEIEDPAKNIPRSLLLGTMIVTVIYVLANVAYISLLPLQGSNHPEVLAQGISHAQNDRVGAAAANVVMGAGGELLMAALIMVSTFGCNNGLILAGSRLYKAMADDGVFFKKAAILNKHQVPGNALWIQAIWTSVLCFSGSYGQLLEYCTFANLLFYILTISGLFVLRKKEPNTPRPYKTFGYPLVPALYILLAGFIAADIFWFKWEPALLGLVIVLLGIPVYYFIRQKGQGSSPVEE